MNMWIGLILAVIFVLWVWHSNSKEKEANRKAMQDLWDSKNE